MMINDLKIKNKRLVLLVLDLGFVWNLGGVYGREWIAGGR
jgi:hypothetical protein